MKMRGFGQSPRLFGDAALMHQIVPFLLVIGLSAASTQVGRAAVGDRGGFNGLAPKRMEQSVRDRFLKEAAPAWNDLRSRLGDLVVVIDADGEWLGRDERVRHSSFHASFCMGTASHYLVTREERNKIDGANQRYSFSVHRGIATKPYRLVSCELTSSDQVQIYAGGALMTCLPYVGAMWSVWWVPLPYILQHDGFKLIAAEGGRSEPEGETVRVAFRYEGAMIPVPTCIPGAVYWAELAPQRSWVVLRSGVIGLALGGQSANTLVVLKYQGGEGAVTLPSRVRMDWEDPQKGRVFESRVARLSAPAASSRGPEEFYLPYYGISESSVPTLVPHGSHFRWAAIALSSVGIVVAIWILAFYGRRRKQTKDQEADPTPPSCDV
ncbi:MAG: hypothetical protein ACP5XB_13195 [Isosphaeraceae bacterium]